MYGEGLGPEKLPVSRQSSLELIPSGITWPITAGPKVWGLPRECEASVYLEYLLVRGPAERPGAARVLDVICNGQGTPRHARHTSLSLTLPCSCGLPQQAFRSRVFSTWRGGPPGSPLLSAPTQPGGGGVTTAKARDPNQGKTCLIIRYHKGIWCHQASLNCCPREAAQGSPQ